MLAMGGNAIDAAVAALFSLSVVEPMMVSPMGAGFFVIRHGATGEVTTLDNYATAPAAARADMFEPVPGSLENETIGLLNDVGHLSVGTPGALAGWVSVAERFGKLPLAELLAPAIRQARRGFLVSPYLAFCIDAEQAHLARFPASAEIFLPGGGVPAVGSRIVREDYAKTLERIAVNGAEEFVTGATADLILAEMERGGGLLTRDDLAGYELKDREPVRGRYRGYEIVAQGPVSSGGTHIVQMLKLLEGCDLAEYGFGSVERVHLVAEALKVAFADRFRYMADPAEVDVPVAMLTSDAYANQRRAEVGGADGVAKQYQAGLFGDLGESSCTTHLNVADADGNVVSATQTLNSLFGSRVTATGSGLLLNNTMRNLDPVPGRTNSIAPGKRILSSMSPTLVLKDGQPVLAIGTPGGHR
ncbi:MAG: gamma-glutamyltransferase, partial [Thermomicrobiales bacterium]|nr:gamma-glutamyltransferase [Thermomicrobiales bacterium]